MNIMKTFKDISRLPEYIQNIWADVRDLSIAASNANSKSSRSHNEMIEKIDLLNKSYQELFRICCSRFNAIDIALEAIKGNDVVPQSSKYSEMASKTEIIEILRGHFDEISIDLDHHDITCSSEDAINSVQSDVEDLTTQVQDIVNTMNDGFNEVREMLKNKNVLINPGESVIVSMFGTPKDN